MRNTPVTIKDIAKMAQVSVSTVSKVFNNYHDVNEKTRLKVLNVAEQLNYTPNFTARSLVKNESKRLGLLIEDYKSTGASNMFTFDLMMGFKQYAIENGYEVLLLTTTTQKQKRVMISNLISSHRLDGVFILGLKFSDPYFEEIQSKDFPCVLFDMPLKREKAGSVGVNNQKGAMMATEHLLELGHRKIAFINGHKEAYVSEERLNGYYLALHKYDVNIDKKLIYASDFTEDGGRKAMEAIMKYDDSITAVFAASDLMAIGAIKYLQSIGKRVPDDISVVGFDDIESASYITPRLTTIRQDRFSLGITAATLLINLINGQSINVILSEPELIIRDSTKKTSNKV